MNTLNFLKTARFNPFRAYKLAQTFKYFVKDYNQDLQPKDNQEAKLEVLKHLIDNDKVNSLKIFRDRHAGNDQITGIIDFYLNEKEYMIDAIKDKAFGNSIDGQVWTTHLFDLLDTKYKVDAMINAKAVCYVKTSGKPGDGYNYPDEVVTEVEIEQLNFELLIE